MISDQGLQGLGLSKRTVQLTGPVIRGLVTVIVLAVATLLLVTSARIARATVTERRFADFDVFFRSSQRAALGDDPYVVTPAGSSGFVWTANLNPPHVVLIFEPLIGLPISTAFAVWVLLSIASAGWAIAIIFREIGIRPGPVALAWTGLALLSAAPTGALLFSAQIAWILWGPVTYVWAAARRARLTAAAIVLGVTMSVKPFLGLLVLDFVLERRWLAVALSLGVAGVCFLLGAAGLGNAAVRSWLEALASVTWAGHIFNASLFGWLDRILVGRASVWPVAPVAGAPGLVWPLWMSCGVAVLLVSLLALRSPDPVQERGRHRARETDRAFAILLSAALLVSPIAWIYYLFFLAGPFAALLADKTWRRAPGWKAPLLVAALICLSLPPGALVAGQPSGWATVFLGSAYFWGLLALWACGREKTSGSVLQKT
jgi:hypothetical protein